MSPIIECSVKRLTTTFVPVVFTKHISEISSMSQNVTREMKKNISSTKIWSEEILFWFFHMIRKMIYTITFLIIVSRQDDTWDSRPDISIHIINNFNSNLTISEEINHDRTMMKTFVIFIITERRTWFCYDCSIISSFVILIITNEEHDSAIFKYITNIKPDRSRVHHWIRIRNWIILLNFQEVPKRRKK